MDNLITIIVPTYRRPSLLLHTLHSCFLQDYRPLEIDVSDNATTDDAHQMIKSLVPPLGITLRYSVNTPATDLSGNINKLFAEARGRRLVLMNDDDVLLSGAVTAMNAGFGLATDVICAYGILQRISMSGEYDPTETAIHNAAANRTAEYTGLRRDLLVCAFWRQLPPVGFMLNTEAARRVGYGDVSRVGYGLDTEFGIRLALAYCGKGAFAFVNHLTTQYRLPSLNGLTHAAQNDGHWKLWNLVAGMRDLSPDEMLARDWLLRRHAHVSVMDHARGRRRFMALRILLSRYYPYSESVLRPIYALGVIAFPRTSQALRSCSSWLPSKDSFLSPP